MKQLKVQCIPIPVRRTSFQQLGSESVPIESFYLCVVVDPIDLDHYSDLLQHIQTQDFGSVSILLTLLFNLDTTRINTVRIKQGHITYTGFEVLITIDLVLVQGYDSIGD